MSTAIVAPPEPNKLMIQFADKYGMEPRQTMRILRETVLKSKDPVTPEEVAAFMIVCNAHELNPFLKEIYGFMSKGKMQYVVGVDGWITLCNRHPQLNGIEFEEMFKGEKIYAVTCKIHRKDRTLPIIVTEYFSECYRDTDPWNKTPIRMTRHKSLIQCARIAFGFAGVIDEDEAERMEGYEAPTSATVRTIEAQPQDEAELLMDKLEYNTALKASVRHRHGKDAEALVKWLKAELAKKEKASAKTTKAKPEQVVEAQPQSEQAAAEEPTSEAQSTEPVTDVSWMS